MWFVRFLLFCTDAVNDFFNKNCPFIAGAISYYTLYAIFPLVLATISILGYVVGLRTQQEQLELAKDIADLLPVSSEFVSQAVESVVNARAITGVASIFGLLWACTAAFGALRKGINAAWGIRKPRPFLKERLIDFALVLGAGMILLALLFSVPALSILREVTDALAPGVEKFNTFFWNAVTTVLYPGLAFLAFLIFYTFIPNTEVHIGDVWPWALLASLAFDATNLVFVWYVTSSFSAYNVVYGSVGGILALLTWVYLSAIIVLFGALITSRYTAYTSSIDSRYQKLSILWAGFSRVRLRIVESTRTD